MKQLKSYNNWKYYLNTPSLDIDINKNSDASLDDGTVIKGDGQRSALYGGSTTAPLPTPAVSAPRDMPEIETMDVELVKDRQGLGRDHHCWLYSRKQIWYGQC